MHHSTRKLGRRPVFLLTFSALAVVAGVQASTSEPPLVNWSAPATYTPSATRSRIRALTDISNPVPFIPTAPCRQYNSLLATPLLQGVNRAVTLTGAPCGIPSTAVAVSVNITVFNITGATGNGVFKVDTVTPPAVAWINYPPTEAQRGNAGTVALNGSGQIIVQVAQGAGQVDFIVDTNGYYSSTPATLDNPFIVQNNSSLYTILGINSNTTCTGACGIFGSVSSGNAIEGISANGGDGVFGQSTNGSGVGVHGRITGSPAFGSVAVFGENMGTAGTTFGVVGSVNNPDDLSAGVLGRTTNLFGSGGRFDANGSLTFVQTRISGVDYSLYGSNRILGGSLVITGAPKSFAAPHPENPALEIRYASVEAPTVDVYFRGTADLVNGYAHIEIPDHFRFTAREGTYMTTLTSVGRPVSLGVESEGPEGILVRGSGNGRFHYVVYAERAEIEGFQPVQRNETFTHDTLRRGLLKGLPATTKALLVKNRTINSDGSYNLETARAQGWSVPAPERGASPTPESNAAMSRR